MRPRGFSLIELIFFIVVVGVGLAGVLLVLNTTVFHSSDPLPVKQAYAIAEGMLEEITLQNYSNPSGGYSGCPTNCTTATRQFFDDVMDYNGFATTGVYSQSGTAITGLSNYNVSVAVNSSATLNGLTPVELITVTVTAPTGTAYSLSAYRTNY